MGKAILPTENNPNPPSTSEQRMGYSSLWTPANLNGYPLFGGPELDSYVQVSLWCGDNDLAWIFHTCNFKNSQVEKGGLTNEGLGFTIMFWFKIDARLNDSAVIHTLLVNNKKNPSRRQ